MSAFHVRTLFKKVHEAVADTVLNAQEGEVQALQRRAMRVDVDAERLACVKIVFPLGAAGEVIDVFGVAVVARTQAHQDAACQAAREAGAHGGFHVAVKSNAAAFGFVDFAACGDEFIGEHRLEPQRADGIERKRFCHSV